jgi:H+/gluconate symporter-like permease
MTEDDRLRRGMTRPMTDERSDAITARLARTVVRKNTMIELEMIEAAEVIAHVLPPRTPSIAVAVVTRINTVPRGRIAIEAKIVAIVTALAHLVKTSTRTKMLTRTAKENQTVAPDTSIGAETRRSTMYARRIVKEIEEIGKIVIVIMIMIARRIVHVTRTKSGSNAVSAKQKMLTATTTMTDIARLVVAGKIVIANMSEIAIMTTVSAKRGPPIKKKKKT